MHFNLTDLDHQALSLLLSTLPTPEDLARASMTCTTMREVLEPALRLRRREALPAQLPAGFRTWTSKMMFDERLAAARVPTLSINQSHGATVHAGRVYVWGTEYVSPAGREVPGMLGFGLRNSDRHVFDNDVHKPTAVPYIDGAVSVACGREHTLALTANGEVYAWGNAEWGACGRGPGRPCYSHFPSFTEPTYLRGKLVVSDTSTFGKMKDGYWETDALYSIVDDIPTASCATCPDCGHPPMPTSDCGMASIYAPDEGGHPYGPFGMDAPAFIVPVPRPVPTPLKILKVAAGSLHSLLLGEDGGVYALGCAYEGRLGLGPLGAGPPKHVVTPTKIEMRARVVDITAGAVRSLAVRADGSVVGWGGASSYLLGLGDKNDPRIPQPPGAKRVRTRAAATTLDYTMPIELPLPAGVSIEHASIGPSHALLVASDGSVYSFGAGAGGALGHGEDEEDKPTATKLDALTGVRIVTATAGWMHSLVAADDGAVYEFGVEDGLKTEDWEDYDDEEEEEGVASRTRGLPVLIGERAKFGWCEPRAGVPFLQGINATAIACGIGTTALRTPTGLVSFGGHENDTFPEFINEEWPNAKLAEEGNESVAKVEKHLKGVDLTERLGLMQRAQEANGGDEGDGCVIA